MADDSPSGLTVKQAAALLGCHAQTVRKRIREGELVAEKTQGAHGLEWRIDADSVESLTVSAQGESAKGEPTLTQVHSSLVGLTAIMQELLERQERLERMLDRALPAAEVSGQAEKPSWRERLRSWWRRLIGR